MTSAKIQSQNSLYRSKLCLMSLRQNVTILFYAHNTIQHVVLIGTVCKNKNHHTKITRRIRVIYNSVSSTTSNRYKRKYMFQHPVYR